MDTPAQSRTTLAVFLALLIGLLTATFWMIAPYVLAVVVGGILSLLCRPSLNFWIRRGVWPKIAAVMVTIGMVLLVIIPIGFLSSMAVKQGIVISRSIADTESYSLHEITSRISQTSLAAALDISAEDIHGYFSGLLKNAGRFGTDLLVGLVSQLPNGALQIVLTVLSCFFFLLDGERFLRWMGSLVPMYKDVRLNVVHSFRDMAVASIWATLAAGAAQSLVMLLTFLALGVPGAFLAGGATFVFAWIPVLGSGPVWVAGAIYLYLKGAFGKMIVMIVLGLLAGVVDNIVRPIVLKGRSDMHPLVSLIAIFGGIAMFGLLGVFLGPVMAAVTISLLQAWPTVAERLGLMTAK